MNPPAHPQVHDSAHTRLSESRSSLRPPRRYIARVQAAEPGVATTAAKQRVGAHAFGPADWALFLSISAIWGSSFLLIDIGLDALEPGVITLLRVGIGALTLAVIPGPKVAIDHADRARFVLLSAIWVGIPFTLFPLAEQHINSATTGLLNGATPIFTAIVAAIMYRHRPSRSLLIGLAAGFAGVVLISLPTIDQGSSEATGVAMVVAATFCYGVAANLSSPLLQHYGSLAVMKRMLALATLWTAPYGISQLDSSHVEAGPLIAVACLGVIGTGLAYLIMATLLGRVGPTRASFITYLIPVVSLVLGVAFRDDAVPALALVGIALVIVGALAAGRGSRRNASSPDS
jgi:drug/metabolite transporter (DMT)-like permease